VSFLTSIGSNALTISLRDAFGSGNPQAATPGKITINNNADFVSGGLVERDITSATSLTVPAGATLGTSSGVEALLYVYLLDANPVVIAVSGIGTWDESAAQSSTAISAGATSSTVLYTAAGQTNRFIRLIGRIRTTQTTAGQWASAVTQVSLGVNGNKIDKSIFTGKGTLAGASAAATLGTLAAGTNNFVLTADSAQTLGFKWASAVASVELSAPSIFTVSGSPVTASGTLTMTLADQSANRVFAGPTTGGATTPTFRALVAGDLPSISTGLSGVLPLANGGTNAALTASQGAVAYSTASAFAWNTPGSSGQVLQSQGTAAPTWLAQANGGWTPTLTNVTNLSASTSASCIYSRLGSIVTFACYGIQIDPTIAGFVQLDISLPIASNFTSNTDAGGPCAYASGYTACFMRADATNDRLSFFVVATGVANDDITFSGQYEVK
jgi:hypothetical protein